MYIITILHTFDNLQRNEGKKRCQTYVWVSATLLYYLCDRCASYLNSYYSVRKVTMSSISGTQGARMVLVKIPRPSLFDFEPGQYALLRFRGIDCTWHPFSIASGPHSSDLEFYIEVLGDKSWTGRLWTLAEDSTQNESQHIDLMGPYGTALVRKEEFSHVLAVGTGTGIVPMLSLFNQHIQQLLRLEPSMRVEELREQQERVRKVERAESKKKGSIAKRVTACCRRSRNATGETRSQSFKGSLDAFNALDIHRGISVSESAVSKLQDTSCKMMQRISRQEMLSICGVVALAFLTMLGVIVLALTISWNCFDFVPLEWSSEVLQLSTIVFQFCFVVVAIFVWDASKLTALVDFVFCILTPLVDWYWYYQYESMGKLTGINVARYCLFTGYMMARFWNMTVRPRHRSWKRAIVGDGGSTLERLEIVWVSRSSALVSEILPIIDKSWGKLIAYWGDASMCRICIYVTDKDEAANEQLRQQVETTSVYHSGSLYFCRPNLAKIIENHTLDLIETRRSSSSVLAFCGSPVLSQKLHQEKISNDMLTAITGNKKHQMEFVSESYGGTKK